MAYFSTTHTLDSHLVNNALVVIEANFGYILACQKMKREAMSNAREAYYKAIDYRVPLETHEIEELVIVFEHWLSKAKNYSKHIRGCRAYLATGVA